MGTHIDEVKRLKSLEKETKQKKKMLIEMGWNISDLSLLALDDIDAFLDKIMESKEVVDTEGISIYASDKFRVSEAGIQVDHRASIEDIIAFLKE